MIIQKRRGDIMASIFRQRYTFKDKNGKTIRKHSKNWYIDYKAADGTRKRVKGFKDKQATSQLAAKLEKESELAQAGVVDRYKKHRQTPLSEHLEDFRKSLGDTTKHARQTEKSVKTVFEACRFRTWTDIQASAFFNHLNKLKTNNNMSQRTYNFYLKAGKQFCRWMVQDQRANQSPLEHLKADTITKRKRQRRVLNADEIRTLLEVTKEAPERFGMNGHERALLYRLAVETGLRANELRNLKVSSFDFNNLIVTVIAGHTKNKHIATIPLRTDTAGELQSFFTSKMPNTKAFGGRYKKLTDRTAEMLQSDLADANISYQDDAGMYFDFHSFRHEAGSLLAASGTHPKVAQSIMRHSDINLTMSLYTHTLRGQESQAVENLPDLSLPSKGRHKATGTDNLPVSAYKPAYKKLTKNAYSDRKSMSLNVSDETQGNSNSNKNEGDTKSLRFAELETEKDRLSSSDTGQKSNGRYRIRTCDPLIKSQLPENDKHIQNKDLQKGTVGAYKPAYKENPKTTQKQGKFDTSELSSDLAEIVSVWPELPVHIKAAIKALIQTQGE